MGKKGLFKPGTDTSLFFYDPAESINSDLNLPAVVFTTLGYTG